MSTPPSGQKLRVAPFAIHATRGLLRLPGARRRVMLATLIAALAMIIIGSTFLREVLDHREHPVWFILFWSACAWLTVSAVLLAIFDLLIVRAQARAARKALDAQITRDSPSTLDD